MFELISFVKLASNVLVFLIFARIMLSWIQTDGNNKLVRWIFQMTEPMLGPVRNMLPSAGGFDFSPIIVLIGIQVAERVLIQLILNMG